MNKFFLFIVVLTFAALQSLSAEISTEPLSDFRPDVEVVGIFIEYGDRVLFLHRQDAAIQGNTWCVPGGKVERNESLLQAVVRETFEEIGYDFSHEQIEFVRTFYVKYSEKSQFLYHVFRVRVAEPLTNVVIDWREHKGFTWVTPADALKMDLIKDEDYCLNFVYGAPCL